MQPLFDGRKTGARPSESLMRTGVIGKRDVTIHSAAAITFISAAATAHHFRESRELPRSVVSKPNLRIANSINNALS
jgi:hypothetical protein